MLLTACASNADTDNDHAPFKVTVTEQQQYSPADWPQSLYADIYRPHTTQARPGVLMVHGGGWEGRSRQDMHSIASQLAEDGFVVVNIDHRFAPRHRFPAQLHDVQRAMHWLRANETEFGIDPERVYAFGFSSGAHLVSMMALVAGQGGELDSPHGGIETRPGAVVAGGVPSDLTKFNDGRRLLQLMGDKQSRMAEEYRQASPVTHIHSEAPPFFFFHGTVDRLVPFDHSEDFHLALGNAGLESELYRVRFRGHLLSFLFSGGATEAASEFLQRQP
ncbi:MAG: alpha/beta hydrolase [Halomonadaceae bacterium]|nr:MAG: alpha/beta hydrolase [Halomonadaceae bacterium]